MNLPNRIFFTGVPGSRWSGIAQNIELLPGFNTSDRTPERDYSHHAYTGHKGAYFGEGMELEPWIEDNYINSAHITHEGCRLIKSHDWAYGLDKIKETFPEDWIMLVYRPDLDSFAWWHEAGGFQIKYPCYDAYKDSTTMLSAISAQNKAILKFAHKQNATWHYFTESWLKDNFSNSVEVTVPNKDILVTIIK